ncbi:hypothetical protein ID853_02605 [Xenorhabdus sp. Vera]|uniref:hypothetical protein n=1 Tax=Xenorhabdus koppenhoeferi TaxID=351659 RepID=UPI0019A27D22|nr:hypothetical protein [Xenorhabdus sp. Vera]MBD2809802.1 hypothetical protein [Xenorhabdus sp. Vera]
MILILFLREQQEQVSFMKSGITTRNANFNHLIDQVERIALHFSAVIMQCPHCLDTLPCPIRPGLGEHSISLGEQ